VDPSDVRGDHVTRARQLLIFLDPVVDALRSGDAQEAMQNWVELVARSAVVRQVDALAHAIRAVEEETARNVAGLVRPAVEELITLTYLKGLPSQDAGSFLLTRMQLDVAEALETQNRLFTNLDDTVPRIPPTSAARIDALKAQMLTLANRYGWPIKGKGASAVYYGATMGWMARETGQRELYDYLYGAASRLVHFSPTELMRRCWFDRDSNLAIGGHQLEQWWASFALGWGSILLARSTAVALELCTTDIEFPPPDRLQELVEECASNIPPLITLSELNLDPQQWWDTTN
jgi:hypothetical protein